MNKNFSYKPCVVTLAVFCNKQCVISGGKSGTGSRLLIARHILRSDSFDEMHCNLNNL